MDWLLISLAFATPVSSKQLELKMPVRLHCYRVNRPNSVANLV